jgi:hypothetical protein
MDFLFDICIAPYYKCFEYCHWALLNYQKIANVVTTVFRGERLKPSAAEKLCKKHDQTSFTKIKNSQIDKVVYFFCIGFYAVVQSTQFMVMIYQNEKSDAKDTLSIVNVSDSLVLYITTFAYSVWRKYQNRSNLGSMSHSISTNVSPVCHVAVAMLFIEIMSPFQLLFLIVILSFREIGAYILWIESTCVI